MKETLGRRFNFWMNSDFCGRIWSYPLVNEHSHGKSPRNVIYVYTERVYLNVQNPCGTKRPQNPQNVLL